MFTGDDDDELFSDEIESADGWVSNFGGAFYQPKNSDGTYSRFSDYVDPNPEIPF